MSVDELVGEAVARGAWPDGVAAGGGGEAMPHVSTRMPRSQVERLDELARRSRRKRTELIRFAVEDFLDRHELDVSGS